MRLAGERPASAQGLRAGCPRTYTARAADAPRRVAVAPGPSAFRPPMSIKSKFLPGARVPTDAASPVTVPGLTAETEYTVRLRAVNSEGSGTQSATVTFTTTA